MYLHNNDYVYLNYLSKIYNFEDWRHRPFKIQSSEINQSQCTLRKRLNNYEKNGLLLINNRFQFGRKYKDVKLLDHPLWNSDQMTLLEDNVKTEDSNSVSLSPIWFRQCFDYDLYTINVVYCFFILKKMYLSTSEIKHFIPNKHFQSIQHAREYGVITKIGHFQRDSINMLSPEIYERFKRVYFPKSRRHGIFRNNDQ